MKQNRDRRTVAWVCLHLRKKGVSLCVCMKTKAQKITFKNFFLVKLHPLFALYFLFFLFLHFLPMGKMCSESV